MLPQVISGQRVVLSLNGKQIAYGTVLDFNIDSQVQEIRGIDSILPIELYPSSLRVTASLRIYRTPDNDPSKLGLFTDNLDVDDNQAASGFASRRYMEVSVRDSLTDAVVLFLPRTMISSRSGSVSSEDLMQETWSIISIGFRSYHT